MRACPVAGILHIAHDRDRQHAAVNAVEAAAQQQRARVALALPLRCDRAQRVAASSGGVSLGEDLLLQLSICLHLGISLDC